MATSHPGSSASANPVKSSGIPLAEWIASSIGLVLVLFVVCYMLYAAAGREQGPPEVHVEVLSIAPLSRGYLARFVATNRGQQAASEIHIVGVNGTGPDAESSEARIDLLPPHSQKTGGLFFTRPPSAATLSLRASGYQDP